MHAKLKNGLSTESSVKHIHSEECKQSIPAVIFHSSFVCQFLYKNAVSGHAGILILRKSAGLTQYLLAGRA